MISEGLGKGLLYSWIWRRVPLWGNKLSLTARSSKNAFLAYRTLKKHQKTSTLDTNPAEDGAMEVYPVTEVPRSWERDARTRKACNVTPLSSEERGDHRAIVPQALGSVANLPSILATSSALLHLISTRKCWLFILIRDWDPTTAAIHNQKVFVSAANAFLTTKTNEILSQINSKCEKRQRNVCYVRQTRPVTLH